jgi:hypothetical protein
LETYLALAGTEDWERQHVPSYLEREFRRYLECGILAYGFARARCTDCWHDFLVDFSCRGSGLYPSCTTRRKAEIFALWIRALLRRRSKNTLIIPEIRGLEELKMTLAEKFDQWAEEYKHFATAPDPAL